MATFEVRADISKNRLSIKLDGFFSVEEVTAFSSKVDQEAKKLTPPFDVISDLTGFKPTSPQGFDVFKQAAGKIAEMGIRNAVRVDSASEIGSMQFKRITKEHEPIVVKSWEEAEALLNNFG